jgi:hypothetical protein
MAIGGYREGAGRKSQWRSPTKMMRLPARYEAQIIAYAKLLDSESKSGASCFQAHVESVLLSIPPNQRRSAKRLLNKLVAQIEGVELAGNGKDLARIQGRLF